MARLLINKNDFIDYKQVSKARDIAAIESVIQEAQDIDLKALICREFFYDILNNYQQEIYQKLIHGETYTDNDGNVVEFKGLKAVLVNFAYARYVLRGHMNDTAFGMVQKTTGFSQPISASEKRDVRDRSIADANGYWQECKLYLKEKEDLFPKWKDCNKCEGSTSRAFKTSTI